jgi:hypothetical protein
MDFQNLSLTWKTLSVMGIIFSIICIILLVILILIYKTDLIPWPYIDDINHEELELEYSDFLNDFEYGGNKLYSDHKDMIRESIADLKGEEFKKELINITLKTQDEIQV